MALVITSLVIGALSCAAHLRNVRSWKASNPAVGGLQAPRSPRGCGCVPAASPASPAHARAGSITPRRRRRRSSCGSLIRTATTSSSSPDRPDRARHRRTASCCCPASLPNSSYDWQATRTFSNALARRLSRRWGALGKSKTLANNVTGAEFRAIREQRPTGEALITDPVHAEFQDHRRVRNCATSSPLKGTADELARGCRRPAPNIFARVSGMADADRARRHSRGGGHGLRDTSSGMQANLTSNTWPGRSPPTRSPNPASTRWRCIT